MRDRSKHYYFSIDPEKLIDKEWDEAEKEDEKPVYYRCKMLNGGSCVKRYKPSVAKIALKRGAYMSMEQIKEQKNE